MTKELDLMTKDIDDLRNEVDCRIEHGAEGKEHLEFVRDALDKIRQNIATVPKQPTTSAKGLFIEFDDVHKDILLCFEVEGSVPWSISLSLVLKLIESIGIDEVEGSVPWSISLSLVLKLIESIGIEDSCDWVARAWYRETLKRRQEALEQDKKIQ